MSEGIEELSLEDIAELDLEDKPRGSRAKKTLNTAIRDYDTWFKLHTYFGECGNPDCEDTRPKKVAEGKAMVAKVNGKEMCRLCFLKGWLR